MISYMQHCHFINPFKSHSELKKGRYILIFVLILLGLSTYAKETPLQKVSLQLKWKHQFQFAGYYAAIEKGYYKDAGLDVSLIEADEEHNPVDQVFNNKAQFGIGNTNLLIYRSQGYSPVILASIFQHSPIVLVASKNSGITYIHDLAGKTIAMEPNTAEIVALIKSEGMSMNQIHIVDHSFDVNPLLSGQVDAMSAYTTDELFLLNEANFDYNTISPSMAGIDFYSDVLFTTQEFIDKNPELVEKFRSASLKGWQYALKNPEEIIELIHTKYGQRHSIKHLKNEAQQMQKIILPDVVEIGYTNKGRWETIAKIYRNLQLLPKDFNLHGFFYSDYIKPRYTIHWKLLGIFMALLTLVGGLTFYFYNTSKKLKSLIFQQQIFEKELSESEKRYRLLVDGANEGILVAQDGRIKFINNRMTELLEYSKEKILASPLGQFIHEEDRLKVLENYEKRINNKVVENNYHVRIIPQTNTIKWIEISGTRIICENKPATLNFINDITNRKAAEIEIQNKNQELSKLVSEKDQFISILAHDLRSPFSSLLGFTRILNENLMVMSMQETQEVSNTIRKSTEHIYQLLENLLEWSSLQRKKSSFKAVQINAADTVTKIIQLFNDWAVNKQILIIEEIPKDAAITADQHMFETILRNLISNAIKFSNPGGTIIIKVEQTSNETLISVKDTGIGMDKTMVDEIFQINNQNYRHGTDNEPSTGLGLLICKEFVELHGGKIWINASPNLGSEFIFTIPSSLE